MEIIDSQLHAWMPPSEEFPWYQPSLDAVGEAVANQFRSKNVSAEQLIWMMDAVGVDAALLTSPFLYGDDHRYAYYAAEEFPGRFYVVTPILPTTADLEARLERYLDHPWTCAIRVIVLPGLGALLSDPYRRIFAVAEREGIPLFLTAKDMIEDFGAVAQEFPELTIVLDHFGIPSIKKQGPERFDMLPDVTALARFDNILVKCSTLPALSRQEYPFEDVWPHIRCVVEAYGPDRLLWGSDMTQHLGSHSYSDALDYLRRTDCLTDSEKTQILGANTRRLITRATRSAAVQRPTSAPNGEPTMTTEVTTPSG